MPTVYGRICKRSALTDYKPRIPREWFGTNVVVFIDRSQWPKDWKRGTGFIVDRCEGTLLVSGTHPMPYGLLTGKPGSILGWDGYGLRFDATVLHKVKMVGPTRTIVIRPPYVQM